jgi:hypothetical protein
MKNNKIFWIVGIIIVGLILYSSSDLFAVSGIKFKLVDKNVVLKAGDCWQEKTIINISAYSKSKNKIFYEDGCECIFLFKTGGNGIVINVPISSDYMTYSEKKSYASYISSIYKSSFGPAKDFDYAFYVEKSSGSCMKIMGAKYICSPKAGVFTTYSPGIFGGAANAFNKMTITSRSSRTKLVILHELGHMFGLTDSMYDKNHQSYPVKMTPEETARVNQVAGYYKDKYIKSLSAKPEEKCV